MDAYKPFVSLWNEYKSEYNETELNKQIYSKLDSVFIATEIWCDLISRKALQIITVCHWRY